MSRLADYPQVLERAAAELSPHDVAFYLRDLASAFHSFYDAQRVLVDDPALRRARLALLAATRQVLRNGLGVLGVSAPEQMSRDSGQRTGDHAMTSQRGGFALGMIVGLLVGLALALGVALYVTKVPIPFVNKVPQRTATQEALEIERNKNWDPNAALGGKPVQRRAGLARDHRPARRAAAGHRVRARPPPLRAAPRGARSGRHPGRGAGARRPRRGQPRRAAMRSTTSCRPVRSTGPRMPSSSGPSWRCSGSPRG